jgi:hypothetical protein
LSPCYYSILKRDSGIFSANSASKDAGTSWDFKSTRRSSSVTKAALFFFMSDHYGLAIIVQSIKKTGVEANFPISGESSVKVFVV